MNILTQKKFVVTYNEDEIRVVFAALHAMSKLDTVSTECLDTTSQMMGAMEVELND
jgi:hypothetical protein